LVCTRRADILQSRRPTKKIAGGAGDGGTGHYDKSKKNKRWISRAICLKGRGGREVHL